MNISNTAINTSKITNQLKEFGLNSKDWELVKVNSLKAIFINKKDPTFKIQSYLKHSSITSLHIIGI